MKPPLRNLKQLLDHIDELAKDNDRVSIAMVVESVGSRSFGPILMFIGIILFSPLSGVPGLTAFMALFVLLVTGQMLIGRQYFWLPNFILARSLEQSKLHSVLNKLDKPAAHIDRVLKPRLTFLVKRAGSYAVAALCVVVALFMPFMEVVPFSSSVAGLALLTLGLALVARDGLLALFALLPLSGVITVVSMNVFG